MGNWKLLRGYTEKRIYYINIGHRSEQDVQLAINRLREHFNLSLIPNFLTNAFI